MGHQGFYIDFANVSSHACTLQGFPGVSAVDVAGHRIGAPATRSGATAHPVTLAANGGEASALIVLVDTGVFTAGCGPRTAAGFRVYPPNETASRIAPFAWKVCSVPPTPSLGPFISIGPVTTLQHM
jgi:hypothetical protein